MDVQTILLGFLMRRGMTGYDLKRAFSISFSFFSGISYGSIYPALKRMSGLGLVTMTVEARDGAPSRKVYAITAAGRKAFLEGMRAPLPREPLRNPFLMRLFFFSDLPREERRAIADAYLESVRGLRRALDTAHPDIKVRADRFQYGCYRFGLRFFEDLSNNIAETIRELDRADAADRGGRRHE